MDEQVGEIYPYRAEVWREFIKVSNPDYYDLDPIEFLVACRQGDPEQDVPGKFQSWESYYCQNLMNAGLDLISYAKMADDTDSNQPNKDILLQAAYKIGETANKRI